MHFEHLVQINDPLNPLLTPLSAQQVWQALLWRAEKPQDFQDDVSEVKIHERGDDYMVRSFRLGNLHVRDNIEWDEGRTIHFHTQPNDEHNGGILTIAIETPDEAQLFVRFTYNTPLADTVAAGSDDASDAYFSSYVKSAYHEADIDTVRRIRELAAQGSLGH
ncbi:AtaL-like protein [Silvimonas soli]|uniref:AtaL-like protein n=1 Tax=Silvimonas soli TaxID=2980100 RepID=UPI0024B37F16|nr:AtaL-like protein [Silvimonas soli]